MAAAVAGPLAAGGEEAAASVSLPGSPGLPGSRSAERALEEAVATGTLNLSNRRLKHFPRGAARSYDLSDITQAGLCLSEWTLGKTTKPSQPLLAPAPTQSPPSTFRPRVQLGLPRVQAHCVLKWEIPSLPSPVLLEPRF
uniref:Leucine-rich repeats and calponin homology (CH) domain containing 4 n=1 Tax=Mus musculus TaxID=10090 RepID=H3BJU9_MOUSE